MLTFDDEGLTEVTLGAGRIMLTLADDVWNAAELAAGFARLTKARGIAATTLDNLTLPFELLELLEVELLLRDFFHTVYFQIFFGAPKY